MYGMKNTRPTQKTHSYSHKLALLQNFSSIMTPTHFIEYSATVCAVPTDSVHLYMYGRKEGKCLCFFFFNVCHRCWGNGVAAAREVEFF